MKARLDKILASNGFGSRRDIKRILRKRTFKVNGEVCFDSATVVDPAVDSFELAGERLTLFETVYLMLNKPAGVISSTEDPDHQTVIDLLEPPYAGMELFPIGRLDIDTEGLLVITNDGPLTHRLTSPKTGVDKTYYVRLRDPVDEAVLSGYATRFASGLSFRDGYTCLPAVLRRADSPFIAADASATPGSSVLVTIQEGKYHQVKKMFKVVENEVAYLKRVSMGNLSLDASLAPGEYRPLTDAEIAVLRGASGDGNDTADDDDETLED
jgi:16S rRNA pseudouridine516 synthase